MGLGVVVGLAPDNLGVDIPVFMQSKPFQSVLDRCRPKLVSANQPSAVAHWTTYFAIADV